MLITFGIHLYEICTSNVFLICLVYFQNCAAIKRKVTMASKHTVVKISLYPWLNGQYMLPYQSKTVFSLNLMPKRGQNYFALPPSIFKSREGNCSQLFRPWSGISEVRTADSYGASEFMSVWIFSCLCVSVFSFLGIRNFLSAIKYLSFCHVILVYLYHILLLK